MTKGYLAISYSNRRLFDSEIESLKSVFMKYNIVLMAFVDKYDFKTDQENQMMTTAFEEINNSDFLIAELTTKSIGVGIEIGYARAKEKPIIYLRKKNSEYSTTAAGSSTYIVEYIDSIDLYELMERIIKQMK